MALLIKNSINKDTLHISHLSQVGIIRDRLSAKSTSINTRPHGMDLNLGPQYFDSYNSELTKSNADLDTTRATTSSSKKYYIPQSTQQTHPSSIKTQS
jgi:hypothetical protein